ncbi:MAG: MarR family transcriptional regulator [Streptosporangiales bacterium]|nr:MarR family transcriptional regulator [Streptosporangiales bacterium]
MPQPTTAGEGPGLSAEEERALHELQEALMVIKQAAKRLRPPMPPDVGENAIPILGVVKRLQPTRVSTLAAELGLAVSTVSRKLEPLVQRGWLDVSPDPDDQRAHQLSLTRRGTSVLYAQRRRQMTRYAELLDEETRSQFPDMAEFFTRVARALHDAAEQTQQHEATKGSTTVTAR